MNDKTPFQQAILALGETPESVSVILREKGIKGYRMSAGNCPIASYLNSCGFQYVTVATSAKRYSDPSYLHQEQVLLPPGIRQWICHFDDGKYPEFNAEL